MNGEYRREWVVSDDVGKVFSILQLIPFLSVQFFSCSLVHGSPIGTHIIIKEAEEKIRFPFQL